MTHERGRSKNGALNAAYWLWTEVPKGVPAERVILLVDPSKLVLRHGWNRNLDGMLTPPPKKRPFQRLSDPDLLKLGEQALGF